MSTCDHSTTYRLSIHNAEHHFREDRPDNKTSGEGPVEEMMTATMMSMNDNVETSEERERVRGPMFGHPSSVVHATSNFDMDFMSFQHGRESAHDERTRRCDKDRGCRSGTRQRRRQDDQCQAPKKNQSLTEKRLEGFDNQEQRFVHCSRWKDHGS